jgi:hypothetical protein
MQVCRKALADNLEASGLDELFDFRMLVRRGVLVGRDAKVEGRAGRHVPSTSGTLSDQLTACRNRRLRPAHGRACFLGSENGGPRHPITSDIGTPILISASRPQNGSIPITASPPTGHVAYSHMITYAYEARVELPRSPRRRKPLVSTDFKLIGALEDELQRRSDQR